MAQPKPKGILVKRSISERPPEKSHNSEFLHHLQPSLSLHHVSNNTNYFVERRKEGQRGSSPIPSVRNAPVAAVQTQSVLAPHRRLRVMNAEVNDEEEAAAAVVSVPSVKPAMPRRTVSFAPIHETQELSSPKTDPSTSSGYHSDISVRADLPKVLQAAVRPDTVDRHCACSVPPGPSPRQLALWVEEEFGPHGNGQVEHLQRPVGTRKGDSTHMERLDEQMKEVASKGTWGKPNNPANTTPGYVATLRRQQYADAYTSFRRPGPGLSKNYGEDKITYVRFPAIADRKAANHTHPSHLRGTSLSLKLEHEAGWEPAGEDRVLGRKSLRQIALE